jgi:hypothetical protein
MPQEAALFYSGCEKSGLKDGQQLEVPQFDRPA